MGLKVNLELSSRSVKALHFLNFSFLILSRTATSSAVKQNGEEYQISLCSVSSNVALRPQRRLLIDFVVAKQDNFTAKKDC